MARGTPRFTRQEEVQTGIRNPSAGAAGETIAAELEAFSQRRNAELDRQAQEQGLIEGQSLEEIPEESGTIRGRARRQGAILAHQAALQTDIRDSVARIALENPNDPEAFQKAVDGLQEGLLEETPPALQPFAQIRIADYAGRAKTGVIAQQQAELDAQAAEDLATGLEGFVDDARTAAFEGDVLLVEARREELDELLEAAVEDELMDDGQADQFRQGFEREVIAQEVIGNFDRVVREQGVEAGADAIARWQAIDASALGITVDDKEAVTRQMVTLRNRERALQADENARADAEARAERAARTDNVKDAIKVLRGGFSIRQDQAQSVAEDLGALEDEDLAAEFDIAQAIQEQVHQFRRTRAADREGQLIELERALRSDGATADQVALLDALRTTHADVSKQMESDPRGFVNREGLIEDAPIDFSSAQTAIESLEARGQNTAVGRQLTGEPLPILTAAEAEQLAQVYNQAELEERVGLLGVITAGSGENALATLGQLDAKGQTSMALLGSFVMQGEGQLARGIMRGQAVLSSDPGIKPKRTDYQASVDDEVGAALADWPNQRQAYLDAAFARYADLKANAGDLSDVFDSGLFEDALNQVMPTARFNGRRVAVPPGVSEDLFEAWTDGWQASDFEGVAGGDPDELLELARNRGRLVELGQGRYGVSVNTADSSGVTKPLVREDGKPLVLTFGVAGAE